MSPSVHDELFVARLKRAWAGRGNSSRPFYLPDIEHEIRRRDKSEPVERILVVGNVSGRYRQVFETVWAELYCYAPGLVICHYIEPIEFNRFCTGLLERNKQIETRYEVHGFYTENGVTGDTIFEEHPDGSASTWCHAGIKASHRLIIPATRWSSMKETIERWLGPED